jgi:hypothetical protein
MLCYRFVWVANLTLISIRRHQRTPIDSGVSVRIGRFSLRKIVTRVFVRLLCVSGRTSLYVTRRPRATKIAMVCEMRQLAACLVAYCTARVDDVAVLFELVRSISFVIVSCLVSAYNVVVRAVFVISPSSPTARRVYDENDDAFPRHSLARESDSLSLSFS